MIGSLLFCQLTLADLTDEQITKLISRLQSKAEKESQTLHSRRGTTYAAPSTVQAPHVPFTHRVMGFGVRGPRSRITIKAPRMNEPKACKCMPHCTKCDGNCDCCTCIFENPVHKVITSEIN
tara:strand:- start:147 stop:512 length:366 start_codon:yes stop_codon:yes gene_type:complete